MCRFFTLVGRNCQVKLAINMKIAKKRTTARILKETRNKKRFFKQAIAYKTIGIRTVIVISIFILLSPYLAGKINQKIKSMTRRLGEGGALKRKQFLDDSSVSRQVVLMC